MELLFVDPLEERLNALVGLFRVSLRDENLLRFYKGKIYYYRSKYREWNLSRFELGDLQVMATIRHCSEWVPYSGMFYPPCFKICYSWNSPASEHRWEEDELILDLKVSTDGGRGAKIFSVKHSELMCQFFAKGSGGSAPPFLLSKLEVA